MPNRLRYEKSPYLRLHADNPIDWYPWGAEALEKAKRENKPIFLSIGYMSCHWCHVMAEESFADTEAAEEINRHYVPVKVDREERPDLDAVYMRACVAMNGSGGWPMTLLLTPEGEPFFAGTYLPKENRGGRIGLLPLLRAAARKWREDPAALRKTGEELTAMLRQSAAAKWVEIEIGTVFSDLYARRGAAVDAPEIQETEPNAEAAADGEGTPEIQETEPDAEAEPMAEGEPAENTEETEENEPIG